MTTELVNLMASFEELPKAKPVHDTGHLSVHTIAKVKMKKPKKLKTKKNLEAINDEPK